MDKDKCTKKYKKSKSMDAKESINLKKSIKYIYFVKYKQEKFQIVKNLRDYEIFK